MIELGLQRISRLLAETPLKWRAIHVAGTNGKGSVCAYASSMLSAYNKSSLREVRGDPVIRHGRFTSPHLVDRWDCITLNRRPVAHRLFKAVEDEILELNEREAIGATQFELLTATAFEIFNRERIDVGVIEVGVGGRLDATNIIGQRDGVEQSDVDAFRPLPFVTAITSIGIDHQDILGSSLEQIAREKAGIIKPGVPVVYSSTNVDRVVNVLKQVAAENHCATGTPWREHYRFMEQSSEEWKFDFDNQLSFYQNPLRRVLAGSHVKDNLAMAFYAVWVTLRQLQRLPLDRDSWLKGAHLWHCKFRYSPDNQKMDAIMKLKKLVETMRGVVKTTEFPGRQQMISIEKLTSRKELVLLDGAHNSQSAQALAPLVDRMAYHSSWSGLRLENIRIRYNKARHYSHDYISTREREPVTWVLATSSSKDAKEIFAPLLKDGDAIFAVEFGPVDGMPWVKPLRTSKLMKAARTVVSDPESIQIHNCGTGVLSALKQATQHANGGPLVIAGSLYLVGDVLRLLRGAKASVEISEE